MENENNFVKSVRECFLQQDHKFIIPGYQRGYKWTKAHVTHLLDSILEKLSACENTDQYFCLQNITLCQSAEGLRVIDGQQRLITLTLILSQMGQEVNSRICFPTRPQTERFIQLVITGGSLAEADSLDEEYIVEAVIAIRDWFAQHSLSKELFLDKVKLIVNLVENQDASAEEQLFANLNGVKAEMDGSDLLRALLITRCETSDDTEEKLGKEFDEMNLWCKQPTHQKFIARLVALNKVNETPVEELGAYHARITFDDKKYPIDLLYRLLFLLLRQSTDDAFNYLFFEKRLASERMAREVLEKLRSLFSALKSWLTKRDVYHFLGFLIFNFKNLDFVEIYALWNHSPMQFSKAIQHLGSQKLREEFGKDYTLEDLKEVRCPWYLGWDDDGRKSVLVHTLILQDVLLCTRHSEVGFLPVTYFTRVEDDIEHIACQTTNEKESNDHDRWLLYANAMKELASEVNDSKLQHDIQILENTSSSEEAMRIINEYGLNSAGNLVLLESSLNRGNGNSVFESKREQVIASYFKNGRGSKRYIRPYTLQVFLGPRSDNSIVRWTFKDIRKQAERIYQQTKKWIEDNESSI